ncbi:hypothetical protein FLBR109950_03465 [Flavobacterium branchiophilum]|uniref:Uncharacterized protein n=2 Tax=Flavobacterium branchiophilum TaxID=55197 RepID=G2Z2N0_FLABF|nr:hypothetical protein [Flavobacterium branchiophilum]PDS24840.1 hypothetical protein B0A77_06860 [Flavobacterium branchiophilum]CCB70202.1 Protein of unknown function [Flavobacterium branchiophilum FL-15]
MPNLQNNRLNITATPAQITAVKAALQTINTNLPFLIGLTTEERVALPAIDVNNKVFTEDAINAAINNPTLVPAYIALPNLQADLTLFSQLDELYTMVNQLAEKLDDTKLIAGSEAFNGARLFYKACQSAAEAGVPGADTIVQQLGSRFANQGTTAKNAPQAPPSL